MFQLSPRLFRRLMLWLAYCVFLTACGRADESSRSAEAMAPATQVVVVASPTVSPSAQPAPATPLTTSTTAPTATPTALRTPPLPTPTIDGQLEHGRYVTSEPLPTASRTPPLPTPTIDGQLEHGRYVISEPLPTAFTPAIFPTSLTECEAGSTMNFAFRSARPLPLDVSVAEGQISFDPPRSLYIAVENWVGLISLEEPLTIESPYALEVVGFVEVPELPVIRDIVVQDDVAFVVGGSQLMVMTAARDCYWFPIATASFPFEPWGIELEGDRLYVGGVQDGQLQIEVLNLAALPAIERLGSLALNPGIWSVVGNQLLTYEVTSAVMTATDVTITDVTDLGATTTRDVPVPLRRAWRHIGQPQLVDDALSLVIVGRGLGSITGLLNPEPAALWREVPYEYAIDSHTAQEQFLFVIHDWADMDARTESVFITTRDAAGDLTEVQLYPHFPVHHYYALSEDVVLAFSDYSLLVIDPTAPKWQRIVRTYPLR